MEYTYENDYKAALWLSESDCATTVKNRLLKLADSPAELYCDLAKFRGAIERTEGPARYEQLAADRKTFDFEKTEAVMKRYGVKAVTIFDNSYPTRLKEIDNPPVVLYCKGNVSLLNSPCFAIVGTRNPSRYGRDVTKTFAKELATAGFAIVSGMARGIDTCAHTAVLEENCDTIAVVACGLDCVYPAENRQLFEDIAAKGLVISEYPIGVAAQPFRFPERNRIISGVSVGVLATEGGLKSGSLITLNDAIEQNRRAFAVPANIMSKYGAGTNEFLKNLQGAMVTEPNDILKEYNLTPRAKSEAKAAPNMAERSILAALDDGDRHFEELLDMTGLAYGTLISLLTAMEVKGMIRKLAGNFYGI